MEIKIDDKVVMVITETDKIYLKHWLPGDDGIIRWIVRAILGKINNRKYWFFKEWNQKLMDDPDVNSIPANEEDFGNMVITRPYYKDRIQRNIEGEEERQKKLEGIRAKKENN